MGAGRCVMQKRKLSEKAKRLKASRKLHKQNRRVR